MIYTVTINPSLDYIVTLDALKPESVNRSLFDELRVGGKGINVSVVLSALGIRNTATGFSAGQTGQLIKEKLHSMGINQDFIDLKNGNSRINTKIRTSGSFTETEINGCGCVPSEIEIGKLKEKLDCLTDKDILVLSGSLPSLCENTLYAEIIFSISPNVRVIADTSGETLEETLKAHPFLIKPNKSELEELLGESITTDAQLIGGCKKLQNFGARNILVTLGSDGGVLVCEDGRFLHQAAPKGKVVYTVGAGDSAVAGFIFGLERKNDFQYALQCSIAAGSATAFKGSLTGKKEFETLLSAMNS